MWRAISHAMLKYLQSFVKPVFVVWVVRLWLQHICCYCMFSRVWQLWYFNDSCISIFFSFLVCRRIDWLQQYFVWDIKKFCLSSLLDWACLSYVPMIKPFLRLSSHGAQWDTCVCIVVLCQAVVVTCSMHSRPLAESCWVLVALLECHPIRPQLCISRGAINQGKTFVCIMHQAPRRMIDKPCALYLFHVA